jgi:hypothetical protein
MDELSSVRGARRVYLLCDGPEILLAVERVMEGHGSSALTIGLVRGAICTLSVGRLDIGIGNRLQEGEDSRDRV